VVEGEVLGAAEETSDERAHGDGDRDAPADRRRSQQRADRGRMFLSVETIKTHVRYILLKLNAANRSHAVALAFRADWWT
jgi:hypothetical protein